MVWSIKGSVERAVERSTIWVVLVGEEVFFQSSNASINWCHLVGLDIARIALLLTSSLGTNGKQEERQK